MITNKQKTLLERCFRGIGRNYYVASPEDSYVKEFEKLITMGYIGSQKWFDNENITYVVTRKGKIALADKCRQDPKTIQYIKLVNKIRKMSRQQSCEFIKKKFEEIDDIIENLNLITYKWNHEDCPLCDDHSNNARILSGTERYEWECKFCGKHFER